MIIPTWQLEIINCLKMRQSDLIFCGMHLSRGGQGKAFKNWPG